MTDRGAAPRKRFNSPLTRSAAGGGRRAYPRSGEQSRPRAGKLLVGSAALAILLLALRRDAWTKVRLSGGMAGQVPAGAVERIAP